MSPQRATRTSWKPKEGVRFTRAIKISLHTDEADAIARHVGFEQTPAEWAREAVRERMRRDGVGSP
jgi:hypothetical protein